MFLCFLLPDPATVFINWISVVNRTDSKAVNLQPTRGSAFVL